MHLAFEHAIIVRVHLQDFLHFHGSMRRPPERRELLYVLGRMGEWEEDLQSHIHGGEWVGLVVCDGFMCLFQRKQVGYVRVHTH